MKTNEEPDRQYQDAQPTGFFEVCDGRRSWDAGVETGHRTVTCCHLGNIAMLLGRKLKWDPAKEHFVNDTEADRMASRSMRAPWDL